MPPETILSPELQAIVAVLTPLVMIGAAIFQRVDAKKKEAILLEQNEARDQAAAKVKADLDKIEAAKQIKLEEIHIDVNSKMAAMKKRLWDALRMLAAFTHDPAHLANSRVAEGEYLDHIAAQARADERMRLLIESQRLATLERQAELKRLIEAEALTPSPPPGGAKVDPPASS